MNHAYRLVWSEIAQTYVPVPESARARGKRSAAVLLTTAAALGLAGSAFALAPNALPTGGQVVGGQATISQAGSAMTIQQTSSRAAIDWQSFNIGANASVTFNQPSASAIALNRVVGQDPSQILGSLSANGQVFIVNPAGVLFGRGAQVNAQGILASTRDISVAGFMDGKDDFSGAGTGQVVNEGTLRAGPGGYVALIGAQVRNLGEIHAPQGDVRLAAADRVTVTLDHGSLASFTVERGTLDALAGNGGLIKADGGRVYLTADAADRLAKAVVNHTGVIEARGVENRDGTIVLLADMNVGTTNVAGTLDASRLDGSKGGFIETSGHVVNIVDGAKVKAGRWLIDPADFTIAATGGNMTGAAVTAALAGGDLEIQSATGSGGGNGDIHVNDAVAWNANTLTLTAARDININAVMTASGTSKLVMNTGTANGADAGVAGGTVKVGFNTAGTFKGRVDFPGRTGSGFLTINGEDYTVINSLGAQGSTTGTDLQGMNGYLNGRYALGGNIDASATSGWNGGAGFMPIGHPPTSFTGVFEGLGHTISHLTINRPLDSYVGLFSYAQGATIRNTGLFGADIRGDWMVGGLVGDNYQSTIRGSYVTGSVAGNSFVGGLMGHSDFGNIAGSYATATVAGSAEHIGGLVGYLYEGNISGSYATGNVSGSSYIGGLAGYNGWSSISNSYATGSVTGNSYVGGLIGYNDWWSTVTNTYATGLVSGSSNIGGLAGLDNSGRISASLWNTETTGQATSAGGGTGKTTAEMRQLATYAGWDMDDAGGTGKTWRIYDGQTGPLLRSFLAPITLTAAYDGSGSAYTNIAAYSGTADAAKLSDTAAGLTLSSTATAGTMTATLGGYASTQQGYDISYGSRTITGTGSAANELKIGTDLSWSAGTLTLNAAGDIHLAAVLTASGASRLAMNSASGTVKADFAADGTFKGRVDFPGRTGTGFLTINGEGYTVINSLGAAGSTTGTDLQGMQGETAGRYAMGGDIDASASASWSLNFKPVYLYGKFDGLGHTITNLVTRPSIPRYVGLFAKVSSTAAVANVGLVGGSLHGDRYLGLLAGQNDGTITNSYATGSIISLYPGGPNPWGFDVGGLVGINNGTITGSHAAVTVQAHEAVGGLVGRNNGTISNSYATGNISTYDPYDDSIWGLQAGGLAGVNSGTITTSFATGNVDALDAAGGLVGVNGGSISTSYATGNVTGSPVRIEFYYWPIGTGGLVGYHGGSISNCYAAGTVSKYEGVGGLVGFNDGGVIANSFSNAVVIGTKKAGLVGGNSGSTYLINSFWNTDTSGIPALPEWSYGFAGIGKTTEQMQQLATYAGWDIAATGGSEAIWRIYEGQTTPLLRAFLTPMTVTATSGSRTYDGTTNGIGVSHSPTPGAGLLLGSATTTADSKNVGTWTVTASGLYSTQQGYDIAYVSGTVDITPKTVTVSGITAAGKVYDGSTAATVSTAGASFSGLVAGDDLTVAATGSFADKNAGNGKTVNLASTYGGADVGNYAITGQASTTAAITPKTLTVSGVTAADKVYDGNTTATVSTDGASFSGLIAGDALTATGAFTNKNAGTGKTVNLAYGGADAGNYAITGQTTTTAAITRRIVTVFGITAAGKVYDGSTAATVSTAGAAFSGLVAGDNLTVAATGSFADKNAGTGKAVDLASIYGGADIGNYSIRGQGTATATITPKAVTLSGITAADKVYDGNTSAAVNAGGAVLSGVVAGDDLTFTSFGGTFANKNAGAGKTVNLLNSYSGADLGNYAIVDQGTATASITPKALTVSGLTASNKVYDGNTAATVSTAGATFSGLVAGDDVTSTGVFANKNVGNGKTVSLTYGGADLGNYTISGQSTATANITPKAVTLSGITAADKVYDGNTSATVNASGAVLSGVVAGDNLTFTSFGGTFANKNAGAGKTVNLLNSYSGADLGNYVITDQGTTTARITPKALTVSGLTASNKVYDGNTAATVNTAGVVYTGLVTGDNLTVAATGSFADKNAGSGKTVTLASTYGGADAGNYAIAGQAGTTASIIPKALAVSGLTAADKVYDGSTAATVSTAGATFSGLVAGDNLTATGSFTNKNAGAGKTVNLAYGGADAGNYAISGQATATASITPKAVTLSGLTAADKVYDGSTAATVSTAGATYTGLVAGDSLTANATGTFSDKNAATGKTVTLTSSYSGADVGNYAITGQATTTASIIPKALTVSGITASDKVYDGTTAAAISGGALSGVVAGDKVSLLQAGSFTDKNAGNGKTVIYNTGLAGADAGNYAVASASGTTTAAITPRALTVALTGNVSKTADGTNDAVLAPGNYVVANVVAGESVAINLTAGRYGDATPGTGKTVTAALAAEDYSAGTGTQLSNYQVATGQVAGAVGEIRPAQSPVRSAQATGYAGALATATQPVAGEPGVSLPPPASPTTRENVATILVTDAQGQSRVAMHIIDNGLRLPDTFALQEQTR